MERGVWIARGAQWCKREKRPQPEEAAHRSRACPTSASKSVEIGSSRFRSAAVSKDGNRRGRVSGHPSRRALKGAPQDEVSSWMNSQARGFRTNEARLVPLSRAA